MTAIPSALATSREVSFTADATPCFSRGSDETIAVVVEDEKRGKQVFYRLKVPCVLKFMTCVEAVLKAQVQEQAITFIKQL